MDTFIDVGGADVPADLRAAGFVFLAPVRIFVDSL
jgi:hypothetical protein